jgi:hypothetical protein
VREDSKLAIVVAVLTALLAMGLTACGGSGGSTAPTTATSDQAESQSKSGAGESGGATQGGSGGSGSQGAGSRSAGSTVKQHADSGGAAAQFRVKGGDNSIQEFGAEASGSELDEAAATLHGFLDARVERNWAKACSYASAEVIESLRKLAGGSKQLQGKGCGAIFAMLSRGVPQSALEEAAKADVGALRVEGEHAFLLYHGARGADYTMSMVREGGAWRVGALAGTPLP